MACAKWSNFSLRARGGSLLKDQTGPPGTLACSDSVVMTANLAKLLENEIDRSIGMAHDVTGRRRAPVHSRPLAKMPPYSNGRPKYVSTQTSTK